MATDALVLVPQGGLMERPEQIIARIKQAREMVIAIQKEVMKPGVHYGIIPGTEKPVLLKEGADVLNMAFQLEPRVDEVLDLSGHDERRFQVTVGIYNADGRRLGFGVGVCSTSEEKYRWRKAYKPEWDKAPVDRRREKAGESRDGEKWVTYQVRTEPADMENTALQMAVKRANVQATRQVHAVSDIFADIGVLDLPEDQRDALTIGAKKVKTPQSKVKAASAKPQAPPPSQAPAEDPALASARKQLRDDLLRRASNDAPTAKSALFEVARVGNVADLKTLEEVTAAWTALRTHPVLGDSPTEREPGAD